MFKTSAEAVAELEHQIRRKADHSWTYFDAVGEAEGIILRWNLPDGKKTIRPVSRHPEGWRIGGMPALRPLYRLPELSGSSRVYLCEGEKAAEAARSIGLTATTSAGGANAVAKTDWGPLAGKEVVILPDNDEPGRKNAEAVTKLLMSLAPPALVKVVNLPELPDKGDIYDWIGSKAGVDAVELNREIEALADAGEPQNAHRVPLLSVGKYIPFPVEFLPEPLAGFVSAAAKAIGCDPSFLALTTLSVCGAAIGNTARLELKTGWLVPPIVWTAVIGESGTAKTPAFRTALKPVRDRQHRSFFLNDEAEREYQTLLHFYERKLLEWKRSKNSSDEPPPKPIEPQTERFIVSDTTIEAVTPLLVRNPRGLLLAVDELAGWFGSFDRYSNSKGSDSSQWLSMFNAESIIVDRKTGQPKTLSVPNAAMCVTGGIQPSILRKAMGTEHRESGLAARLLMSYPPRVAKQWTENAISPNQEAIYAQLINGLYDLPFDREPGSGDPKPFIFQLSPDAKRSYIEFYNRHATEQAELSGDLSAAWSKLEEYAGRLALIFHLVRFVASDPKLIHQVEIDATSMTAAIQLTEWFKHEARRVYAMLSETEAERDQRRLADWIDRKGHPVTPREVQQGCRWLKESRAAEQALQALVNGGVGTWISSPKGQPGQPTRRFQLSPVYGNPITLEV
ncbi:MAG: DUF3987 domain-containing protein [Planctomycetaceae bacterium]